MKIHVKFVKKKDPICGMIEEKGKGYKKYAKWFCNNSCLEKYELKMEENSSKQSNGSCCH